MPDNDTEKLRFRPRARIIRTIGDQLISGPEAAVIELVKNAYDADAARVTITFVPPLVAGEGRISVQDDGHGMSLSDIQDKWMEPATASKVSNRRSPKKTRQMMGSKGIGRFAAAKLGRKMALNSVSDRAGVRTEVLIPDLDWSDFSGDKYLSDIAIDFYTQQTDEPTGTLLEIQGLNETWGEAKIRRLLLELRRLVSPLDQQDEEHKFEIFLDLSACTKATAGFDGATLMASSNVRTEEVEDDLVLTPSYQVLPFPLLTSCDYEVKGSFDIDGKFTGTFQNRRAGQGPETIHLNLPLQPEEDRCGIVEVRLFLFDREPEPLKNNMRNAGLGEVTAAQAKKILDEIAGVAIYRSGFRIRPYGDSENDWLTLDRRRVQNPSMRVGHNQIAGYVVVQDHEISGLDERSSREGFEDNGSFRRLTRLAEQLLTQVVEPKRYAFRETTGIARKKGVTFEEVRQLAELQKVRKLLVSLPPAVRQEGEALIDEQAARLKDRLDQLEEKQRILEAKSSLGAIVSEVLHEGAQPAAYLSDTSARLHRFYRDLWVQDRLIVEEAKGEFEKKLPLMSQSGLKLATLFRNLKPLAGGKRGAPQGFNVVNTLRAAIELYSSHHIEMMINNPDFVTDLIGYRDDLSTALVNLIGNSVHWLEDANTPAPRITLSIRGEKDQAIIYIDDNGPGVKPEFAELIFDVGFSLKSGGTGLGLNIAKEALARSDASLFFHMDFEDGARFEIRFPRMQERE